MCQVLTKPWLFTCGRSRFPSSTPLPPLWSVYVHPEGATYFHCNGTLRVVTYSDLYSPGVYDRICVWTEEVKCQAKLKGIIIEDQMELFIQLDDDDCNYYFVDTKSQSVFWIEEYEPLELGLGPVVSPSHLSAYQDTPTLCTEFNR